MMDPGQGLEQEACMPSARALVLVRLARHIASSLLISELVVQSERVFVWWQIPTLSLPTGFLLVAASAA
jgi:hypothetical protein